jgi:alpha-tubulin suppressor-like RCC1 family protein
VSTDKGELYGWGVGKNSRFGINEELVEVPRKVPFNRVVREVSAGNWHTMVIDSVGEVYGVGHNKYGALGIGSFNEAQEFTKAKVPLCKNISCGDGFSLFLTQEGDLYTSGHNSFHGHKTKENINVPTKLKV